MLSKCPYSVGFTALGEIRPLWCGSWKCEACRRTLAAQWAKRAYLHVDSCGTGAYVWHLTLRSNIHTSYQGYRELPKLWDNLRKRVQRHDGTFSYLACVEAHPRRAKIPHFHVVTTSLPFQRINDLAYYSGFGYIARCEPITSRKGAAYVTKYASKYDPSIPKNFRRVRTSQDWAKLPPYAGNPLTVRGSRESIVDFLLRVQDRSSVAIETLKARYENALDLYDLDHESRWLDEELVDN